MSTTLIKRHIASHMGVFDLFINRLDTARVSPPVAPDVSLGVPRGTTII